MAHAHESNTKRIWMVFGLLSVVTIVEVIFGIYKPKALFFNDTFEFIDSQSLISDLLKN